MKLSLPSVFKKQEPIDYFFALLLRDEKISVVLFEERSKVLRIVTSQQVSLSLSLDEATFEQWLDAIDKALSKIEAKAALSAKVQKTIFGVKEEWVEEGKIKKEYLLKLKQISEELELTPIGFLIFAEAIAHLLQTEEGAPVSALLVEIGRKKLSIILLRAGRIIETKQGDISESVVKSVDLLLAQFVNTEILPSRIIIFHSEHNEHLMQSFIGHSWSTQLPFLHVPQITVLPSDFDTRAILYGTASQLGLRVHDTAGAVLPEKKEEKTVEKTASIVIEEEEEEEHITIEQNGEETTVVTEEFGFIREADVLTEHYALSGLGSEEVGEKVAVVSHPASHTPSHENEKSKKALLKHKLVHVWSTIKKVVMQLRTKVLVMLPKKKTRQDHHAQEHAMQQEPYHNPSHQGKRSLPLKRLLIIPLVVLLAIGALAAYIFVLKAQVFVFVNPKEEQEEQSVTFGEEATSVEKKNIHAEEISVSESSNISGNATGTKQVGTKATGAVTIYNKLTSPTTLAKGTVITASDGLTFTLDQSVTVASASGANDPTAPTTPGTAQANVTASAIGTQYNEPSGRKFTITSSDVGAKNEAAFSGGTQRQATIVSQADVDKLLATLTKNLQETAVTDLQQKSSDTSIAIPLLVSVTPTKKTLSKNVGEEATTVSLQATITYTGLVYKKEELDAYVSDVVKAKKTPEEELAPNATTQTLGDFAKQKDGAIAASLAVHTKFIPHIETSNIASQIAGKSFAQAESIIKKQSGIDHVSFVLVPPLPFLPSLLPRIADHIMVATKVNE